MVFGRKKDTRSLLYCPSLPVSRLLNWSISLLWFVGRSGWRFSEKKRTSRRDWALISLHVRILEQTPIFHCSGNRAVIANSFFAIGSSVNILSKLFFLHCKCSFRYLWTPSLLMLTSHSRRVPRGRVLVSNKNDEVGILGADQKERGLWGRKWLASMFILSEVLLILFIVCFYCSLTPKPKGNWGDPMFWWRQYWCKKPMEDLEEGTAPWLFQVQMLINKLTNLWWPVLVLCPSNIHSYCCGFLTDNAGPNSNAHYVPVKSKLKHPPGHTPGIWRLFLPGRERIWLT